MEPRTRAGGGTAVDLGLAMAGTDFLSVDATAARIMGFTLDEIGYLHYCSLKGLGVADADKILISGDAVETIADRPFKPHRAYRQQLAWRIPSEDRYLNAD